MSSRRFNWGIIGCGHIAGKFAESLQKLPNATLHAVASRSMERANHFVNKYSAEKAYSNYESLAMDPAVDIVYIATTHNLHKDHSLLCLHNKKAVLCEKPIAVNAVETREMVQTSLKMKTFLMEAFWTRYLPSTVRLLNLIQDGEIGDVKLIKADFGFSFPFDAESRVYNPHLAGGALLDVGIYPINFAQMIYRETPRSIQSSALLGPTGVDEQSSYILSYSGNRMAVLYSAMNVATKHDAWIFGTKGFIHMPDFFRATKIHVNRNGEEKTYHIPFESTGYGYEAAEVMRCLDEGAIESPVMPHSETIEIMEIMDSMRKSWGMKYPME